MLLLKIQSLQLSVANAPSGVRAVCVPASPTRSATANASQFDADKEFQCASPSEVQHPAVEIR